VAARELIKTAARALATVVVTPCLLSYWVRSKLLGADRALEGTAQMLALMPGLTGQYLRAAFYSRALHHCDKTAVIGFGTLCSRAGSTVEENVYVGPHCDLGLVHIERDVMIAAGVHIPSGARTHGFHQRDVPMRDQPGSQRLVRIGAGAWIGNNAVVMADVGKNSIVGAGAVVTRAVPDDTVVTGVPARVLKPRDESDVI
jgi:acetyltransferase-like isoleucine patch superfamily enzyme